MLLVVSTYYLTRSINIKFATSSLYLTLQYLFLSFLYPTHCTAKNQKAIYSKLIYDEIRAMNPPGRFLKQDADTKLWSDIGEKNALDKTRQALREGAPELVKELEGKTDTKSTEYKDALGPLRAARQNNPLANSLMGNISLGSFSLNSIDPQRSGEASTPPVPGIPGQIQMNNPGPGLTQEGANALLVAATQMQLQQQQQQQQQHQQLQLLQQQAGNINPAQLQLLQNHLQMNQQQQQPNAALSGGGNNMFLGNNGGYDAALAAAQASSNMGSEQVAALLNAIHNQAANNSSPDMLQQQLTQQLLTQNLLNQMNNPNTQTGNTNQNIQHGFHTQHEDSTVAANSMGASSRERAQRIGLKNSFTQQRRPNRHLKNNEQTMSNSLMSVETINMDQLRMSGVSLGEFTGAEMHKLFESDRDLGRDLGKAKDKTDDVSEVSDAMSEDAMSTDEKETGK